MGRYRIAIEDDEPRDREVWNNVAKFWYNKASDNTPDVGRLYHHLAILAPPYTLEQLSLYTKSLTCVIPFESAKGSIMTLFNPILSNKSTAQTRPFSFEVIFIRAHAILFTSKPSDPADQFHATCSELERTSLFEKYMSKTSARFKKNGVYIAISNIAALFEYGHTKDIKSKPGLRKAFEDASAAVGGNLKPDATKSGEENDESGSVAPTTKLGLFDAKALEGFNSFMSKAMRLTYMSLKTCFKYPSDGNVYPLIHVYLGFLWSLTVIQPGSKPSQQDTVLHTVEQGIPWTDVCLLLNTLAKDPRATTSKVNNNDFPRPYKETAWPLPEDYIMRGLLFFQWYFPTDWFTTVLVDDDERRYELPSSAQQRKERLLWLGHRISAVGLKTMMIKAVADCL